MVLVEKPQNLLEKNIIERGLTYTVNIESK
jgi:hypothetical protein